eukprot:XP_019928890.1 PREDICTED: uncharacterized protein LOC109620587 [Crassostrea gigas]
MGTANRFLSPFKFALGEEGGEIGSILIMSIVLGILVVPTVVYGQRPESDLDAVNIVTGINVSVRLLAAVTLVVAFTAIRYNMQEWVNDKSSNMIIKTKLVFIWIFGFAKMVFIVIQVLIYLKCRNLITLELTETIITDCFTSIIFVILQLVFFQYFARYTFTTKPLISYISSVIAIANFMDFFIVLTLSVNENKDLIFDRNKTDIKNCTGFSHKTINNIMFITEAFKAPIALQFSALAITFAFSMKPDAEKSSSQCNILGLKFSWTSPKRLAKIITTILLMNVPLLVCAPFNILNFENETQSRIWLSLVLAQKTAALICILSINYLMFKKLNLTVKYVSINANEFMLLLSTIGVMACMSMLAFYQREVDGILTSLIVISLPSILYQVIIILFGRRMDLIGNQISAVHSIQQLVLILGCQNITLWFNDFLYGVWDMSNDHILRHSVFKYIALILYPLIAYYRFQSAMELMELYRHVS